MAPADHLRGIVAKIIRAEDHFGVLDRVILAYLEMCRDRTRLPTKINAQKNTIRLTFEPMPEATLLISMIMGDCVHNMRSALDRLWKRLGRTDNFPLFADIDGPNNWLVNKTKRLTGLPADAQAIIDRLQPCHAGKDAPKHPLTMLTGRPRRPAASRESTST